MTAKTQKHPGNFGLALDFGPLLVFFLAYKFAGGVIMGTIAFMIAISVAVILSKIKLGRVSPMLWLSAILVVGFGILTIYFNDERFIQIKPTIIYALFSGALFAGLAQGKPLLKVLLQAAYDGLSDKGWLKLSRNWACFFLFMALLNEGMRATLDFDHWLTLKVWGVTVLSMAFALANIPMMLRHGLMLEQATPAEATPPQG